MKQAPAARSCRMGHAAAARALIAAGRLSPSHVTRLAPAGPAAVAVAAIAAAAQHDLHAATGAQEQAGRTVHARTPDGPKVLDGRVPARQTCLAPPSSARCGARRGRQACRRGRPLPCPPSSASASVVSRPGADRCRPRSRRPRHRHPSTRTCKAPAAVHSPSAAPSPAGPPCRAARQANNPNPSSRARPNSPARQPRLRVNPKPRPHRRIRAVPDQRSHLQRLGRETVEEAALGGRAASQGDIAHRPRRLFQAVPAGGRLRPARCRSWQRVPAALSCLQRGRRAAARTARRSRTQSWLPRASGGLLGSGLLLGSGRALRGRRGLRGSSFSGRLPLRLGCRQNGVGRSAGRNSRRLGFGRLDAQRLAVLCRGDPIRRASETRPGPCQSSDRGTSVHRRRGGSPSWPPAWRKRASPQAWRADLTLRRPRGRCRRR